MNVSLREQTITHSLFALGVVIACTVAAMAIYAADTGDVNATVTVQNIALTVSDGSVAYGVLAVGGSSDTTASGVNDSQTTTNSGNVAEDFNIKGYNTTAWTLAGSAGSEQYYHAFCTTTCDATPVWTALTTNYQQLSNSVATSGTQVFDLKITVPTATATYTQQTAQVTVQAVAD